MSEQPSVVLFSFYGFPPLIDSLAADPEETKNIAGKKFSASFRSLLMMRVHVLRVYWTLVVRGLQLNRFFTSLSSRTRASCRPEWYPAQRFSGTSPLLKEHHGTATRRWGECTPHR